VTFLGRLPEAMEERLMMRGGLRVKMDDYIKQRANKWKFPWQILKDMDAQVPLGSAHPRYPPSRACTRAIAETHVLIKLN
jgi:hypothetical protein